MKWVTRKHIRTNRLATAWLIRRFVDPNAVFSFVTPERVREVQEREGAIGFDAPGAVYEHNEGVTSFEQILRDYKLTDPILHDLAKIVHAADIPGKLRRAPEAAGLQAISRGFPLIVRDDQETVERGSFLYDAFYAALKERREKGAG